MEQIIDSNEIAEYVSHNISKDNKIQSRLQNAFLNAQINNKELLKVYEEFCKQQNPNFDNSKSFISIFGLYGTVKEIQDNECLAIIAYSRFKKDEKLFEMISEKFLKNSPTFFNLASSGVGNLGDVIDDAEGATSLSFNIFLIYYSDYNNIIFEMTGEKMMDSATLEVQKKKVSKLITIVKPARINVYFRNIPTLFIGSTDKTREDAEFEYGFTTDLPPIGQVIQDVNSFTDPSAMQFLTWDILKTKDDGTLQGFLECSINGEKCVVMSNYSWTKRIWVDENNEYVSDEEVEGCKEVALISRLFRKKHSNSEPWALIEFGTDLAPLIPISVWTHNCWYIFAWPLDPPVGNFDKDYTYKRKTMYVRIEGAFIHSNVSEIFDISDLVWRVPDKLFIRVHSLKTPSYWGALVDAQVIKKKLYLQRLLSVEQYSNLNYKINMLSYCLWDIWHLYSEEGFSITQKKLKITWENAVENYFIEKYFNPDDCKIKSEVLYAKKNRGYFIFPVTSGKLYDVENPRIDSLAQKFMLLPSGEFSIKNGKLKSTWEQTRQQTSISVFFNSKENCRVLGVIWEVRADKGYSISDGIPNFKADDCTILNSILITIKNGDFSVSENKLISVHSQTISELQRKTVFDGTNTRVYSGEWTVLTLLGYSAQLASENSPHFLDKDCWYGGRVLWTVKNGDFVAKGNKLLLNHRNEIISGETVIFERKKNPVLNSLWFTPENSTSSNSPLLFADDLDTQVICQKMYCRSRGDFSTSGTKLISTHSNEMIDLSSQTVYANNTKVYSSVWNVLKSKKYAVQSTNALLFDDYNDCYMKPGKLQLLSDGSFKFFGKKLICTHRALVSVIDSFYQRLTILKKQQGGYKLFVGEQASFKNKKITVVPETKTFIFKEWKLLRRQYPLSKKLNLINQQATFRDGKISFATEIYSYIYNKLKLLPRLFTGWKLNVKENASVSGSKMTIVPRIKQEVWNKVTFLQKEVAGKKLNITEEATVLNGTLGKKIRIIPKQYAYTYNKWTLAHKTTMGNSLKIQRDASISDEVTDIKMYDETNCVPIGEEWFVTTERGYSIIQVGDFYKLRISEEYEYSDDVLTIIPRTVSLGECRKIIINPTYKYNTYKKATLFDKYDTSPLYKVNLLAKAKITQKYNCMHVPTPVDVINNGFRNYYGTFSRTTGRQSVGYTGFRELDGSLCFYVQELDEPVRGHTHNFEYKNDKLSIVEDTITIRDGIDEYKKIAIPALRDFKVKGYSEYFLGMTDILNSTIFKSTIDDSVLGEELKRWCIIPTATDHSLWGNTRTAVVVTDAQTGLNILKLDANGTQAIRVEPGTLDYGDVLLVAKLRESKKEIETMYSKAFVEAYDYLRFLFYVPLGENNIRRRA